MTGGGADEGLVVRGQRSKVSAASQNAFLAVTKKYEELITLQMFKRIKWWSYDIKVLTPRPDTAGTTALLLIKDFDNNDLGLAPLIDFESHVWQEV